MDRLRPSLKSALEIANDPTLLHRARTGFHQLTYSAGTLGTKSSLFKAWCEVMQSTGQSPLPMTPVKCEIFCAVMRASGFRATYNYLLGARERHARGDFSWTPELQVILQDCKRACQKGLGPCKRAEEVRLTWWQQLYLAENGATPPVKATAPAGGVLLWSFGTHFLLREAELACLDMHSSTVLLARTVTLALPVTKTDPSGRGARRTLRCCGDRQESSFHGLNCPYEVAKELVVRQVARTNVDRDSLAARSVPLAGQQGSPFHYAAKADVVEAAQLDAARLAEIVPGHFMRRSGVKALARAGTPKELIMQTPRHSSAAIEAYLRGGRHER